MDIEKNIHDYIYGDNSSQGIKPLERYASFDYCFNHFQSFHIIIENSRLATLDFMTGQPTNRLYTRAKVIDMVFFIEGGK